MATIEPRVQQQAFYADVATLLKKHGESLSVIEMLAIASQIVGKLVGMQDPNSLTMEAVMETVMMNIRAGNQEMVEFAQSMPSGKPS
jgi:hypothetical protein